MTVDTTFNITTFYYYVCETRLQLTVNRLTVKTIDRVVSVSRCSPLSPSALFTPELL
jgi:hypothetical protein